MSDSSTEAMRVRMARFALVLSIQAIVSFYLLRSVTALVPEANGTIPVFFLRLLPFASLAIPAVPAVSLHPWCFPQRPYEPCFAYELRELVYRTDHAR